MFIPYDGKIIVLDNNIKNYLGKLYHLDHV